MFYKKRNSDNHPEWLRLTTSHGKVQKQSTSIFSFIDLSKNDYQKVQLTEFKDQKFNNPDSFKWKLQPTQNRDKFYIFLDYQDYEQKPRLMSSEDTFSTLWYTDTIVSSQRRRGYDSGERDSWFITCEFDNQKQVKEYSNPFEQTIKEDFQQLNNNQQIQLLNQLGQYLRNCELDQVKAELYVQEFVELMNQETHSKENKLVIEANLPKDEQIFDNITKFNLLSKSIRNKYTDIELNICQEIREGCQFYTIKNLLQVIDLKSRQNSLHLGLHQIYSRVRNINDVATQDQIQEVKPLYSEYYNISPKKNQVLIVLFWSPLNNQSIQMIQLFNKILTQKQQQWLNKIKIVALSFNISRIDTKQIIIDQKWSMIEFYYCDRSNFLSDFALQKPCSLLLVDQNNVVIYKKDKFEISEPWAQHINKLINGEQIMFLKHHTDSKYEPFQFEQSDDDIPDISAKQKENDQRTLQHYEHCLKTFKERLAEDQQMVFLLNQNKAKIKAAHIKFTYSQVLNPKLQLGQDVVNQFKMKIILTGEREAIEFIDTQIHSILSKENQLFKLFCISDEPHVMNENIDTKRKLSLLHSRADIDLGANRFSVAGPSPYTYNYIEVPSPLIKRQHTQSEL